MKFERPIKQSVVAWVDQTGYPNDLVSGSPEHGGAHEHLLSLAVEMESDFEPWGKRTRDEEPSADCSCGCRHYAILAKAVGRGLGRLHKPTVPEGGPADI